MEVTVKNIVDAESALGNLLKVTGLTVKTNYRIGKVIRSVEGPLASWKSAKAKAFNDMGDDQLDELGKPTGMRFIKPEFQQKVTDELTEALNEKVEIPGIIEVPGDVVGLSAADLLALEPFIKVIE